MILKNKKFVVVCSSLKIPIDEDELVKVYESLKTGDVKILRKGWFNPSFFVGIQEDEEYMNNFRRDKHYDIQDGKIDGYPEYQDLFASIREEVKKLSGSKKITL